MRLLFRAMGGELANVHLSQSPAAPILRHLKNNDDILVDAARTMAKVVRMDQRKYAVAASGK